jgi:hypothetical protein
MGVYGPAIA